MEHIIKKFNEDVENSPDKIAIVTTNGDEYTYEDVNIIVNNLASYFQTIGIEKGAIVPLFMKRDEYIIFTTLALFIIGASYVPIADSYPKERIDYILNTFSNKILLTNHNVSKDFLKSEITIVNVTKKIYKNGRVDFLCNPDDLAYILFTSGSTGRPKGVKISHKNLMWILSEMQKKYPQNDNDAYLFATSYTFDVSVTEMFSWIVSGTKLIIPCMEEELIKNISKIIEEMNITHLAMSPSFMKMLVTINENNGFSFYKKLKYVFLAGEKFPADLAIRLRNIDSTVKLYNLYGPTETTVYATHHKVSDEDIKDVPIGKPFDGVKVKVFDKDQEVFCPGEKGELYISGEGVCQGYYKDEVLTNEKFPIIDGVRYFKTGDYVYIDQNEDFVYVERIDQQVQINGIRVELGEIETNIKEKFYFAGCKVLYNDRHLICFYINEQKLDDQDIINELQDILPKYMVPRIYIKIDSFPITTNRKIDNKELLKKYKEYFSSQLDSGEKQDDNSFNEMADDVLALVKKYTNIKDINIDSNLLGSGIDSLDMVSVIVMLEEEFDITLPNDLFYMMSTVRTISEFIKDNYSISKYSEIKSTSNMDSINPNSKDDISKDFNEWNLEICDRKNIKEYNTLYLQKVYHYDKFESFLHIDIQLANDENSIHKVSKTFHKLIMKHELLRSVLHERDGLYFMEKECKSGSKLIKEYSSDDEVIVKETIVELLKNNKLDSILFYPYIIRSDNVRTLKVIVSHKIMDQKSVFNIKKDFYSLIDHDVEENPYNYESFVRIMEAKNNDGKFVTNDHITKLLSIPAHSFTNYNDEKIFSICFEIANSFKSEEHRVQYMLENILDRVLQASDLNSCIASTILNYRNIDNYDFNNCVGDYHTAIVFPYFSKSSGIANIIEDVMNLYKNGYQPQQYVFRDYPNMNDEQKKLEYAIDLNVYASINYLGEIRKDDLDYIEDGLYISRNELSKFPGKKMYITCFTVQGKCYAYFLTTPKEMKKYCEK